MNIQSIQWYRGRISEKVSMKRINLEKSCLHFALEHWSSTSALMTFWSEQSFVLVAVLVTDGCLAFFLLLPTGCYFQFPTPHCDKQKCLQTLPLSSDWEPYLREKVNGDFYGKEPYIWSVIDDRLLKLGHVCSIINWRSNLLQRSLPLFLDAFLSPIHLPQIWQSH